MAVTSTGLSYKVKIDGQLLLDERRNQTSEDILTPQSLHIRHGEKDYRLEIGPVSALGYGVHVYDQNRLIHRYKNCDFVMLSRHEKIFGKFDKLGAWFEKKGLIDKRPFWKIFLEACLIGGLIGLVYAGMGGPKFGNLGIWPVALLAGLALVFWPKKLRVIR